MEYYNYIKLFNKNCQIYKDNRNVYRVDYFIGLGATPKRYFSFTLEGLIKKVESVNEAWKKGRITI